MIETIKCVDDVKWNEWANDWRVLLHKTDNKRNIGDKECKTGAASAVITQVVIHTTCTSF